ncbi:30881_t:CDS:2, partial [Gigaspora margarita]
MGSADHIFPTNKIELCAQIMSVIVNLCHLQMKARKSLNQITH